MLRTIIAILITLAIVGCEKKNEVETEVPASADTNGSFDAFIEYQGKRYEFVVFGDCGSKPDGTYDTRTYTVDAEGLPVSDGAHMYAMSKAYWSVIDFYPPLAGRDHIVRVYREGKDKFGFDSGVLEFDGELGAGLTDRARVRIVCPKQSTELNSQRERP